MRAPNPSNSVVRWPLSASRSFGSVWAACAGSSVRMASMSPSASWVDSARANGAGGKAMQRERTVGNSAPGRSHSNRNAVSGGGSSRVLSRQFCACAVMLSAMKKTTPRRPPSKGRIERVDRHSRTCAILIDAPSGLIVRKSGWLPARMRVRARSSGRIVLSANPRASESNAACGAC